MVEIFEAQQVLAGSLQSQVKMHQIHATGLSLFQECAVSTDAGVAERGHHTRRRQPGLDGDSASKFRACFQCWPRSEGIGELMVW